MSKLAPPIAQKEVAMSLRQDHFHILSILSDNLRSDHPQLVPTATIAEKSGMQLPELHQLLKSMTALAIIQTDADLQYNLITRKGLNYLEERHLYIPSGSPDF